MALICANSSYTYKELMELEFIYYKDLLVEIGLKLQYLSISNVLGRSYTDEKIFELVDQKNPVYINHTEREEKEKDIAGGSEKVTITKLREVGLIK